MLPCIAVSLTCLTGHVAQGSVPFEFERNQILLQLRIGGQGPFSCTVDTGANPSVIDLALARELGLSIGEEAAQGEGVGTGEATTHQTEFEVAVGNQVDVTVAAVTLDLASLSKAFGRPIHCVLGQSWLDNRLIRIDYASRELYVGKEAARLPATFECSDSDMKFWMADDLMPLVTAQVNGVDIPVSLDTGSSGTLKLFSEGAEKAGIIIPPTAEEHAITGARGSASVAKVTLRSLKVGPLIGEAVQGTVGQPNEGEQPGRLGNLGNGFLQRGVLVLDYAGRRIRLCARR